MSGGRTDDGSVDWTVSRIFHSSGYLDAGKTTMQQVVTGSLPFQSWPEPNGTDAYTPAGYKHERIDLIYYKGFSGSPFER